MRGFTCSVVQRVTSHLVYVIEYHVTPHGISLRLIDHIELNSKQWRRPPMPDTYPLPPVIHTELN